MDDSDEEELPQDPKKLKLLQEQTAQQLKIQKQKISLQEIQKQQLQQKQQQEQQQQQVYQPPPQPMAEDDSDMADISREEFPRHIESNGGRLPPTDRVV